MTDGGEKCANEGWLVPGAGLTGASAWRSGEPIHGCANLHCGRCGRKVLEYPGVILQKRPSDPEWLERYDRGELERFLGPQPPGFDFRLYICACRAFACGAPREVDELALEDDLPWYCGGHSP